MFFTYSVVLTIKAPFSASIQFRPSLKNLVGLLFWVQQLCERVLQSYRGVSQKDADSQNMIGERKMSKQLPPAHTINTAGPRHTISQISQTP